MCFNSKSNILNLNNIINYYSVVLLLHFPVSLNERREGVWFSNFELPIQFRGNSFSENIVILTHK